MIEKKIVEQIVERELLNSDGFLVEVAIDKENNIVVEIDSLSGVDIDTCAAITRAIEAELDRDIEDYSLEVGSAGLTSPMRVRGQFEKNIGNDVEILTNDGRKLHAVLKEISPADVPTLSFTVTVPEKVKVEGKKKPQILPRDITFSLNDVKYIVAEIKF